MTAASFSLVRSTPSNHLPRILSCLLHLLFLESSTNRRIKKVASVIENDLISMKENQYLMCNWNAVTQLLLNIKNSLNVVNVIHAITSFSLPFMEKKLFYYVTLYEVGRN